MTPEELDAIRVRVDSWKETHDHDPQEAKDIDRLIAEVERLRDVELLAEQAGHDHAEELASAWEHAIDFQGRLGIRDNELYHEREESDALTKENRALSKALIRHRDAWRNAYQRAARKNRTLRHVSAAIEHSGTTMGSAVRAAYEHGPLAGIRIIVAARGDVPAAWEDEQLTAAMLAAVGDGKTRRTPCAQFIVGGGMRGWRSCDERGPHDRHVAVDGTAWTLRADGTADIEDAPMTAADDH